LLYDVSQYKNYGYVVIDGITIYDKYGDNIDRYLLQYLPNVADSLRKILVLVIQVKYM